MRWWDTYKTNDGGAVFDGEIRKFYQSHTVESIPGLPKEFTVTCMNPSTFQGRGGIKILQHEVVEFIYIAMTTIRYHL